jgi:hypothetical protein
MFITINKYIFFNYLKNIEGIMRIWESNANESQEGD